MTDVEPIGSRASGGYTTLSLASSRDVALERLTDDVEFCVFVDANETPVGLARRVDAAALLDSPSASVQEVLDQLPPSLLAAAGEPAGHVAREFSTDLYRASEIPGLIVLELGRVIGVVPRDTLVDIALDVVNRERGSGDWALPGIASVLAEYFSCPSGHYRVLISEYDPANPPLCPVDRQLLQRR